MNLFDAFITNIERMILINKFGLLTSEEFSKKSEELKVRERINQTILNAIYENFSEEKKKEFEVLLENGEEDKIESYFTETIQQIPDLENLMLKEFEKLKDSI